MKNILIYISLFVLPFCYGQEKSSISISTQPLGIFDFFNGPNVNLGGEIYLNTKSSNSFSAGYYLSGFQFISKTQWEDLKGFYIKDEYRKYFQTTENSKITSESFWGIEVIYGNQSYIRSDSIVSQSDKIL